MTADRWAPLTPSDRERLTFFKWGYMAQAEGFTKQEAARLVFMRWLRYEGAFVDDDGTCQ